MFCVCALLYVLVEYFSLRKHNAHTVEAYCAQILFICMLDYSCDKPTAMHVCKSKHTWPACCLK